MMRQGQREWIPASAGMTTDMRLDCVRNQFLEKKGFS
jgi:hypothetical protein